MLRTDNFLAITYLHRSRSSLMPMPRTFMDREYTRPACGTGDLTGGKCTRLLAGYMGHRTGAWSLASAETRVRLVEFL